MRRKAFKIKSFTQRAEVKEEAEAILRRCIELDPTDARAYNSLGKHLQLERRFEEAGKVYDDGLAVNGASSQLGMIGFSQSLVEVHDSPAKTCKLHLA